MVYILLGEGFEEMEAVCPYDILNRGGVEVCFAGVGSLEVRGSHGIKILAETEAGSVSFAADDVILIPGGLGGVESIEGSEAALELIRAASGAGARLAAICAGPRVLAKLGLLEGKKITCYPGMEDQMTGAEADCGRRVVIDGRLITGMGPGSAMEFGLALLTVLKDERTAAGVRAFIHYD